MKTPTPQRGKYKLSTMEVGEERRFKLELHDKIRLAAYFTGKRYGRKYVTRKRGKTIFVYREK